MWMYVWICMCACMYVCMDGWMDGWMHACTHVVRRGNKVIVLSSRAAIKNFTGRWCECILSYYLPHQSIMLINNVVCNSCLSIFE